MDGSVARSAIRAGDGAVKRIVLFVVAAFVLCGCVSFSCVLDVEKDRTGWMVQESRCDIVKSP